MTQHSFDYGILCNGDCLVFFCINYISISIRVCRPILFHYECNDIFSITKGLFCNLCFSSVWFRGFVDIDSITYSTQPPHDEKKIQYHFAVSVRHFLCHVSLLNTAKAKCVADGLVMKANDFYIDGAAKRKWGREPAYEAGLQVIVNVSLHFHGRELV